MPASAALRGRRPLRSLGAAVVVALGAYAVCYLAYAAWLAGFADEGALPPRWRVPDLPPGATVVAETEQCASGGCWRRVVVRPAGAGTAEDLVEELGLVDDERQGWRWYDPHAVRVGASVVGDAVHITVGY